MTDRFSNIKNVLLFVLVLNWGVAFAKVIYGLITNCVSMTADGFHSFSDGAFNIIGMVGIWAATRPTDKEHPYGHKKYETLTTLTLTMLFAVICFNIIRNAISRFLHPVIPQVNAISFIVMFVTIAVNIAVVLYESKKGRELNSDLLLSDALHTKTDLLVSASVIATLISVKMGYPVVDVLAALLIAVFIGRAAFQLSKKSSSILCDETPIVPSVIQDVVMKIDGVKSCHKIRARGRPDDIHVDLHILVETTMHVGKAHELSNLIENRLKDSIKGITDVVVHIEPYAKDMGNKSF